MHLTEREYRATQPLTPDQDQARRRNRPQSGLAQPRPRSTVHALMILARAENTLALVTPVLVGAALGWWETGRFNPVALVLSVLGVAMSGWGFAALCDYVDYRFSQRPGVRSVHDPLVSGFGLMARALLRPATVRDLGRIWLAIGALCSLWLAVIAGWPILFFSGLSFVILWAAVLLPLHYGSRGWGMGEIGIFLGLGLLPLLGSFYIQGQTLSQLPLLIGVPFSLLTMLLFFNYNAVYFRRDWLIHKRTLTVNLGLARSMDISALVTVLAHVAILLVVVMTDLPLSALVALAALPIGLGIFAQLDHETLSLKACRRVYQTSVHGVALAGGLFCAALLLDKLF